MNSSCARADKIAVGKSWGKAILGSLPMLPLSLLLLLGGNPWPQDPFRWLPLLFTLGTANLLFFLMIRTGKTDRWRAVYFILMAVCFVIGFLSNFQEARGSMSLSEAEMIKGRVPFCHMVIPQTAITAALTRTIIFPGSLFGSYGIASMLALWLGVTLALGRGFCGWGCFFGGLEDGFSRILKKPVLRNIDAKWTYMPYAVLLVVVLASTAFLSPFYCEWMCPFKAVTEFAAVASFKILLQTILFVSLFLGLVVVLPILTKKRTQCGLFCPMGAFQSFTNKINPFTVRIDREKCSHCLLCAQVCPSFSLDEKHVAQGKTRLTCLKCGKCVDVCPHGAVSYHIQGAEVGARPPLARMLFLYPAFLFLTVFGSGMIQEGLYRLLLFSVTGAFIR